MNSTLNVAHWALGIHGGAGGLAVGMPSEEVEEIRLTLVRALAVGAEILSSGGTSLQAVQQAVQVMEDSGVLNAGRGAVLNHEGYAELDAAIMDGKTRAAGAVAGVCRIANPIGLARLVMDRSPHVMLIGTGAEQFAREHGIEPRPAEYFVSERRRRELDKALDKRNDELGLGSLPASSLGTVGAVALDQHANLAAATSTGGLTNKHVGRVGDSPIIGAGTYAENGVVAVSTTGSGEYFLRCGTAGDLRARMRYRNEHLEAAARHVLEEVKKMGGTGGLIAMDQGGEITMPYLTPSMLRGMVNARMQPLVFLE